MTIWPLLATTCVCNVGCIGLSHEYAVGQWGVHARLVDGADSMPIAKREIVVTTDGHKSEQRTDRNGSLQTPTRTNSYWTWLGGPAMASKPTIEMSITAADYQPYSLKWNRLHPDNPQHIQEVRPFIGQPYLDFGVIKLKKR